MSLQKPTAYAQASAVLLALLLTPGCGSASQTAANAASQNAATQTASTPASGGSVALTEPTATNASVSKIRITVLDEAVCSQQAASGQGGPGDEDNDGKSEHGGRSGGHRAPPHRQGPPTDRAPPPPPRDGRAGLADAGASTDAATGAATGTTPTSDSSGAGVPAPLATCVVKSLEQPYQAGAQLSVTGIPDGQYTVTVLLEDASGGGIEQGSANVIITSGQVATADITLAPVPVGSVLINIHQASATKVVVVSAALTQAAGACGALSVQSQDAGANAAAPGAAVTLALASSAATGAFYSDSACATAVTTLAMTTAASSATVYYKDTAAGTPSLSFTDAAAGGLGAATALATITAQ